VEAINVSQPALTKLRQMTLCFSDDYNTEVLALKQTIKCVSDRLNRKHQRLSKY
jgi:hypothetical protein